MTDYLRRLDVPEKLTKGEQKMSIEGAVAPNTQVNQSVLRCGHKPHVEDLLAGKGLSEADHKKRW